MCYIHTHSASLVAIEQCIIVHVYLLCPTDYQFLVCTDDKISFAIEGDKDEVASFQYLMDHHSTNDEEGEHTGNKVYCTL